MTRKVHTAPGGKESARAFAAYQAYRSLGPGRSLEKLCAQFKAQAQARRTDPRVPLPPSTNLDTLKGWSARWCWAARLAVEEAESEQVPKSELQRLAREQAREDARLLHSVGQGAIATAAVLLQDLLDPATGAPKRVPQPRDIQPLVRAGIDCLSAAAGTDPEGADANADLRKVLDLAPAEVKEQVLRALHVLSEWRTSHEGRHG